MGCARSIFQGNQRLNLSFLGGQDKFSRGVMTVRASLGKFSRGVIPIKLFFFKGDFWCHPLEFLISRGVMTVRASLGKFSRGVIPIKLFF